MSGLKFTDDLVGHLAWPLVALVGIFVLRQILLVKIDDMTRADVAIGNLRFAFRFRARRKARSELELIDVDLKGAQDSPASSSRPNVAALPEPDSAEPAEEIAPPEAMQSPGAAQDIRAESPEETKEWETIRRYLFVSPHLAIHLAGLRIVAALDQIVGADGPPLGMLVRPAYLAKQGLISQELADASVRLLRIQNAVEGSPKFMLTQEIAEDFVAKAHELVAALASLSE